MGNECKHYRSTDLLYLLENYVMLGVVEVLHEVCKNKKSIDTLSFCIHNMFYPRTPTTSYKLRCRYFVERLPTHNVQRIN